MVSEFCTKKLQELEDMLEERGEWKNLPAHARADTIARIHKVFEECANEEKSQNAKEVETEVPTVAPKPERKRKEPKKEGSKEKVPKEKKPRAPRKVQRTVKSITPAEAPVVIAAPHTGNVWTE